MNAKLYSSFSEWVNTLKKEKKDIVSNAEKTCAYNWNIPKDRKETSSLDVDKVEDKFDKKDCQDAYTEHITGANSEPVDALIIKFQNSLIDAHELAYRIRHTTTPRSFAAGLCDGMRWSNGCVPDILINRVAYLMKCYNVNKQD